MKIGIFFRVGSCWVGTGMLMAMLPAITANAFVGGDHSGGGGAIVCRDSSGTIQSAELLDLWEVEPKYRVFRTNEDVETQTAHALEKLRTFNPGFAEAVTTQLAMNETIVEEVPANREVAPPTDAENNLQEIGCKLEGVAKFDDVSNALFFEQRIIPFMPNTDQAALKLHEAIYRLLRETEHAQNSIKARMLVAYLFTDKPWHDIPWEGLAESGTQLCSSPDGAYQLALTGQERTANTGCSARSHG
jgi:hypothetical protein